MSAPRDPADDLLAFIAASPTPYHAVAEAERRLAAAGFSPLDEREPWPVAPGLKGYVVRGGGTLVAFEVGGEPPAKAGFVAVAAHTDSPNLRVKPAGDFRSGALRQLAVEVYGGVLLSTWLDRDLSIAGRVTLASGETRLVRFDEPLCRIPNLAIHLDREVNRTGLVLNPQKHLSPLWALGGEGGLRERLAERLGREGAHARPDEIFAFDLCLYDTQPPARGGEGGALLFAPRLDNLASCHAALSALVAAPPGPAQTRVVALYDHEEVGSRSAHGAASRFLLSVLERLATAYPDAGAQAMARAAARSFLVSADMAHAQHPNYADKHDERHAPQLGAGPVIKINVNQSYATDAPSAAAFEALCRAVDVAPQRFVARNDMPCGSTVGPITAAQAALRTVDVGNPMLSMHSCREMAAAADVAPMVRALGRLFASPPALPPAA
ncbi:MAG TPA: M18 family aminopeptidase [Polyangiaceae bacterium]|nr:M18 family aminopeptidase [Polyangiaceae bacterium]